MREKLGQLAFHRLRIIGETPRVIVYKTTLTVFYHLPNSLGPLSTLFTNHTDITQKYYPASEFGGIYRVDGNWVKLLTDRLSTHSWTFDGWAAVSAELRQRVERS